MLYKLNLGNKPTHSSLISWFIIRKDEIEIMNFLKSYIRTTGEEWKINKIIAVSDATLVPVSFSGFLLTTAKVASATGMIFLHYTNYTAPCKQANSRKQQIFSRTTRSQVVGHPYHTTDSFYILTPPPCLQNFQSGSSTIPLEFHNHFHHAATLYLHNCFKWIHPECIYR